MLRKTITYEDFAGNTKEETFYFGLNKTELTEMQLDVSGGLGGLLKRVAEANDTKSLVAIFKKIILASVGRKSDDDSRFWKSEEITQDFVACPAFDVLFNELASDDLKAIEFIKGIIPNDMQPALETAIAEYEKEKAQKQSDSTGLSVVNLDTEG